MRTSTSIGIAAVSLAAVLGGSLAIGSAVVASAKPTGHGRSRPRNGAAPHLRNRTIRRHRRRQHRARPSASATSSSAPTGSPASASRPAGEAP